MGNKYFHLYRSESEENIFLGKGSFYVSDRPGELSGLAGMFAENGVNIILFYYNRSEHPNRVIIEAESGSPDSLLLVSQKASEMNYTGGEFASPDLELRIMDILNILNIEVRLLHRPGTLSAFAGLLAKHRANVIYMAYNEDISETSANFAIAVEDTNEISVLLKDINECGYYFNPIYRGAGQNEADDIIGLNLMERFFFHLKKLMHTDHIEKLRGLVESSGHIANTLVRFSHEAGKHFEMGDVITNVLAFASASLTKTGDNFSYRRLPAIEVNGLTVHIFRMPTGGNIIIVEKNGDRVMIDGGYGLYYEDVKKMLRDNGIEPGEIKRIYLSHADADHAGLSGYFSEEYGSKVWLHAAAKDIIAHENRAWGSGGALLDLNHYFTSLVNAFTTFRVPAQWIAYGQNRQEKQICGFSFIDSFTVDNEIFHVLESHGGHVPGQVFFLNDKSGLLFSGDYLLFVESLETEERDLLNIPKLILTSTNVNSSLFRREMDMLRSLIKECSESALSGNREVIIIPGHGDYYSFSALS
jgi:glyoxylase-like metal-dependent hydrolase (beta-lactamase superfamily II)